MAATSMTPAACATAHSTARDAAGALSLRRTRPTVPSEPRRRPTLPHSVVGRARVALLCALLDVRLKLGKEPVDGPIAQGGSGEAARHTRHVGRRPRELRVAASASERSFDASAREGGFATALGPRSLACGIGGVGALAHGGACEGFSLRVVVDPAARRRASLAERSAEIATEVRAQSHVAEARATQRGGRFHQKVSHHRKTRQVPEPWCGSHWSGSGGDRADGPAP